MDYCILSLAEHLRISRNHICMFSGKVWCQTLTLLYVRAGFSVQFFISVCKSHGSYSSPSAGSKAQQK